MGDDLSVVNAARVSFDKESKWERLPADEDCFEGWGTLSDADTRLIHYLAKHGHWSPFTHAVAKFRVKAPIFVARQLAKHQVGLSWNEVSRRYVDSEPEFYTPEVWRKRAENVKQGSSDEPVDPSWDIPTLFNTIQTVYSDLLKDGVCPEMARMVLPQAAYTEWIWTGSLYAWARVCSLRLDSHTQKETQEIAKQISGYMKELFPVSWEALVPSLEEEISDHEAYGALMYYGKKELP